MMRRFNYLSFKLQSSHPGLQVIGIFKIIIRMLKIISKKRFGSMSEFQIIEDKKIGCGSFGTVKLARHRNTCRMYAIKIINWKDLPSEAEAKLVERQIKLHSQLDHPHIIKLWDTISDDDRICMIMEYAEGGNLFYHQNTKNVFSETEAFKFFAQTLQGVQYLHSQNIIHRDLKPQNLLLDGHCNIKLCDFGWCAEDIRAKRTTFCGTYEYMAPQMLFKSDYDYRVDIWALGILLYEMLHGNAPFKGKDAGQVQETMLRGNLVFSSELSQDAKQLITSILQFQAQKRLSIEQIYRHRWVRNMSSHINHYLKVEDVIYPKDIHRKLLNIPSIVPAREKELNKHRKNNSLNFQDSARNINIKLEINNYAFVNKCETKNKYHSQQKQKECDEVSYHQTAVKKYKMEPVCKSQVRQLDRMKFAKSSKVVKEEKARNYRQFQIKKEESKKKFKLRKSEVDLHNQRHPIRFNTEACDKQQWLEPKLKKNKAKQMPSIKSLIRFKYKD